MKHVDRSHQMLELWICALVLICCLFYSSWLMIQTFSYDTEKKTIIVATRLWSDFGAHIPLIRSFSLGDNFDRILSGKMPEYPLFPGEPIRYHFLFFALVGLLEKIGVRIDWALNIPSITGFFLLMSAIYIVSWKIFKDTRVGVLSLMFFLFNGSLSFLRFFQKHPLSSKTVNDILHANDFPSFAPWGPGDVTAFWNMNIYTNQRHLALAFGLAVWFIGTQIWLLNKPYKKQLPWAILWGLVIGILPFLHQPTLFIVTLFGICYFLFFPRLRWNMVTVGIVAAVLIAFQFPYLPHDTKSITYFPGYLIHDSLTQAGPLREKVFRFLEYWFQNLGGHMILAPIGFIIVNNRTKKVFAPLLLLFLFPNLLKFSVEIAGSHKFFNFFLIMSSMLSAYCLIRFFDWFKKLFTPLTVLLSYGLTIVLIFFLTLSGVIDFFVVKNDPRGTLADINIHPVASWIAQNTPKDTVFLNGSWFFNPASIAGRKIILGWPYFSWSAGYNSEKRLLDQKRMLESTDLNVSCSMFRQLHVTHILTEDPQPQSEYTINYSFFETHFPLLYENEFNSAKYKIYSVSPTCPIKT